MTIVRTEISKEVVIKKDVQTTYVCDHCGKRWDLGQFNRPEAINSLQPPRSWWRIAPADSSMLWEDKRTKHLCSLKCLKDWAGGQQA